MPQSDPDTGPRPGKATDPGFEPVLGPRDTGEAVTAGAGDLFAPLCGREDVIRQLLSLAGESARTGQVRFCLVTGAPGVGKTRVLHELRQMLETRSKPPVQVLSGTTGGEGAQAYGAVAELLRQRFEIDPREPAPGARDKLLRGCRALLPGVRATEVAHLLGELLRVPFPESPVTEMRQPGARVYLAVKRLLTADASRGPMALLFDEMEHASAETVNLLRYLAEGLSGTPVFLCAFARPEIEETHPTFGQGDLPCERIELQPLSKMDSVALLLGLTQSAGEAPMSVIRHVEQRLHGSPRAIVELVRLFLETQVLHSQAHAGGQEVAPGWELGKLRQLTLPHDMEELVYARLRAMDPAERDLLEKAAVCGEHFWVDAVVAVTRCSEVGLGVPAGESGSPGSVSTEDHLNVDPDGPTLEEIVVSGDRATSGVTETLRELTLLGLVRPLPHSTISGESEFRFAYPPLRDVIYEGIPGKIRRRYHGLLAQWLDLTPDGHHEEAQEAIARHLERAGRGDAAARRYQRAAEAACERYAHGKATRLFLRAIACLGTVDLSTRITLWHELGRVFHTKGDYDNALSAYEKVVRLSWVVASRAKAAIALLHMGQIWRQKGEPQLSLDYLSRALELFTQAEDQAGVADTLDDIGQVLWLSGRYDEALDRSATALEQRRRLGDRAKIGASLLNIGNIERHRGLFEEADACYREALALRRADGHKGGIAACLNAVGVLGYQRGDVQAARRHWEEALALSEEIGATPLQMALLCHLGEALMAQGSLPDAEAHFRKAQGLARDLSDRRLLSESTRALGLLALRRGNPKEALQLCQEALTLAESAGVRVDVGRSLLSLGEVHAATLFDASSDGKPAALDYLRRGVALFREIGNDAELALGLERIGRYQLEHGETQEGRALLSEAQEIFNRLKMRAGESLRKMLDDL